MIACLITIAGYTNLEASTPIVLDMYDNDPAGIVFQPADEFIGPQMVGLYFKEQKTATINDPLASTSNCIFVFEKIIEKGEAKIPTGFKFIGSYTADDGYSTTSLYGKLRPSHIRMS